MGREDLQKQMKLEQEAIEMMVIAYQANRMNISLRDAPSQAEKQKISIDQYIQSEFKKSLMQMDAGQAFSPEQAERIAQRYTPLAVLDKDGAGAIIFRDNTDKQNIVAVRGTDTPGNTVADVIGADGSIGIGILPMYQTSLIDNFIAQEITSVGKSVA